MSKIQEITARYNETKSLLDVAELGTDEHAELSVKLAAITKEFVNARLEETRADDLAGILPVLLKHKISGVDLHNYFMKNSADYKAEFKGDGKSDSKGKNDSKGVDNRERISYDGELKYAGAGPNLDIQKQIMLTGFHPDKSLVVKVPMKYGVMVEDQEVLFSGHGQLLPKPVLELAMEEVGLGKESINLTMDVVKSARNTLKNMKHGDTAFGGKVRVLEEEVPYDEAFPSE